MKSLGAMLIVAVGLFSSSWVVATDEPNLTKAPDRTVKVVELPAKWKTYADFETLQKETRRPLYIPGDLPIGYVLVRVEFQKEMVRAFYRQGEREILFMQSPIVKGQPVEEKWTSTNGETAVTWSDDRTLFLLKGSAGPPSSELNAFRASLRLLSDKVSISLPYESILSFELEKKSSPTSRGFKVFTPDSFRVYAKEKGLVLPEDWRPRKNSIVIALFAGEKGSSGYGMATSHVTLKEETLLVTFHETEPLSDDNALTVLTYPHQFIEVPIPDNTAVTSIQFLTTQGQSVAHLPAPS
ncbi:protease complex subunit PrcB family protein [Paenibacillus harenae]